MRYHVLATDYDATLADRSRVSATTLAALEKLKGSGRRLVLVTGRELEDLFSVFPNVEIFDRLVVENGAVLYNPETKEARALGAPAPPALVVALHEAGVPVSAGRVIIATREPHETTVLEAIRELGLEYQVVFNKGAVMVLPTGINKATGLAAALDELGLSHHNCVGIGDAENDHAFLRSCACGVAVANALPATKEQAVHVTEGEGGAGVVELIDGLIASDLAELELAHLAIDLGHDDDGELVRFDPYRECILVCGPSGGGKSTVTTGIIERLFERHYQYCVIDPEGDYDVIEGATRLGDAQRVPSADEVLNLLARPDHNAVVNLLGLKRDDRPPFFHTLLSHLRELRGRTGRPHWLVVDETHHLLPTDWNAASLDTHEELHGVLFVTVHPEEVAKPVMQAVRTVIAIGDAPDATLAELARGAGIDAPPRGGWDLEQGEAVVWRPGHGDPIRVRSIPPKGERRRHVRKYAEGELGDERSFYFRGPDERLNLRAQNLTLFLQIGEGVDPDTWLHHLHQGDYSRWLRDKIRDDSLADEVAALESEPDLAPDEGRAKLRELVERRYTAPA